MKKIILKIILILSFAPYVFCLGYGIYSAIFGFGFLFSTSYGFYAFMDSIFVMGLVLCYYPVIPVCLIYQLVYLTVFIIKNRHNVPKKTVLWISSAVAFVIIITAVFFIHF